MFAKKNRRIGQACLLAIVCILCLASPALAAGKIDGNIGMVAEPVNYTVVCLPANYATDPASQDLLRGFSSDPTMVAVRNQSHYVTYTPESPVFKETYSKLMPQVAQGKAGVLVTHGDEKVYCQYGATSAQISQEMQSTNVVAKMSASAQAGCRPGCRPNCPSCFPCRPKPQPQPEVKPEPMPVTPTVIEPTLPAQPVAPVSEANTGQALAVVGVVCLVFGAVIFKARM